MIARLGCAFLLVLAAAACDAGDVEGDFGGGDPGDAPGDTSSGDGDPGDDPGGDPGDPGDPGDDPGDPGDPGDDPGDPGGDPGDPGNPMAICSACHGSEASPAPPRDLQGNTERSARGVGAHQQHLGASDWRAPIACGTCHIVPDQVGAPTHLDGDGIPENTFSGINADATYDRDAIACSNLYCHGNGRNLSGAVSWLDVGPLECNSCHGAGRGQGLGGEHNEHLGEGIDCSACHDSVVAPGLEIIGAALHVDGEKQVDIASGGTFNPDNRQCSGLACHGRETW